MGRQPTPTAFSRADRMNSLWLALSFLTRLPVPTRLKASPSAIGQSVLYYPVVGAVIGGILAIIHAALSGHPNLDAAVLVITWAGLSGALHLDGLADCADAWIGGQGDRERSLAIMKDPRSGPAGVVATVLVLLLKYAALTELGSESFIGLLILTPLLGRTAILFYLITMPYLREQGLASSLLENMPHQSVIVVMVVAGSVALLTLGSSLMLWALVTILALRQITLSRLGGCTGDTLGASVEVLEASILAGAVILS